MTVIAMEFTIVVMVLVFVMLDTMEGVAKIVSKTPEKDI